MNLENHPCFNEAAHKTFGRVHLPVAPRCNIQCKFCNRKFDCVNESRPGVTSAVLSPHQAMAYLGGIFKQKDDLSVVGIAGPGDPFANPVETLETLRLVRRRYPDVMLCVATNGLNVASYVDALVELKVTHVTVTINAINSSVAKDIYSWVRLGKKVFRSQDGAGLLLERQEEAIKKLKSHGITVKVNSIIIPGINDGHIQEIARRMSELHVDILNCVPYYPAKGSAFEAMAEPSSALVSDIRKKAGKYIKQMRHCTRCRADAVGLLTEAPCAALMESLRACESLPATAESPTKTPDRHRPNVAVASMEGMLVNQHLGEASRLLIYGKRDGMAVFLGVRNTPEKGTGPQRWENLAETIADCGTLLVSGIGEAPQKTLKARGIDVVEIEGIIEEAVNAIFDGKGLRHMLKRDMTACGKGCTGAGMGCG